MSDTDVKGASIDMRVRNGELGWIHIESEYLDVVDDILETLVPEGPYAYTVSPMPTADGSIPYQKFVSTPEDLRTSYEDLHRVSWVRQMQGVAEIRGDWYLFVYGLGEGFIKPTKQVMYTPTAVMFPTMGRDGITGELYWTRSGRGAPYTAGSDGLLAAEVAVGSRMEALVESFRSNDAGAVASLFHDGAQVGIRDHVQDTGTLAEMHSASDVKAHFEAFYARFKVLDVSVVQRFACDWFAFSELLWIVEERNNPAQRLKFYTAAHGEVLSDGKFASLIGHGTEREPV